MQKGVIYHKSAKGTEAIATRQHGLSPKQRSMLIMIDGKRSFDELARLSAMLGDTEQLMTELENGGFIEPLGGASGAPAPGPAPAPAEAVTVPAALPAVSLPEAKRFAVRLLTDTLGPMAEELCLRIEGARNAAEFSAAITRAEALMRQVKGTAAAARFAADVAAHPPAA